MSDPATTNHHHTCGCSGSGSVHKRQSSPGDDLTTKKPKKLLFPEPHQETDPILQAPLTPPDTRNVAVEAAPPGGFATPCSVGCSSLPPLPSTSTLRRTISDPSAYSQWLRRVKDNMRELSHLCDHTPPLPEMTSQEQSEDHSQLITENDATNQQLRGEDWESNNSDESVTVEKTGDSLNVRFNCPCGKAYHFVLSQGSCFYKLM